MAQTIRFHLDESVSATVAKALAVRGIDITLPAERQLLGASDTEHLAFGLQHHRVIITHDRDYLRLHADSRPHAGIAYCHQDKYSISELFQMLLLLHECYRADDMIDRVEYL